MQPYIFKRLVRDTSGNIAMSFALLSMVIIVLTGVSVDIAQTLTSRDKLRSIAESAVLAAVSKSAVQALQTTPDKGKALAETFFRSQSTLLKSISSATGVATATIAAGVLTVKMDYTGIQISNFGNIIGITSWPIGGHVEATAGIPPYVDIFLLLDASPSMGIGATDSDVAAMQAATGCAFACHAPATGFPGYAVPDVPGTQLRIDVLQSATAQLISTASTSQSMANQIRIGLYTFANTVTTLSDPSSNFSQLQTLLANIALPLSRKGTQIGDSVDWLNSNKVTTSGNGSTSSTPMKFVFLVTDGVEDIGDNYTAGRFDNFPTPRGYWYGNPLTATMMSSACDGLKAKGVTVAVLYTNYVVVNDIRYTDLVQPFAANIPTALRACASSGYFYQANTPGDINTALQQMFASAMASVPRISN